MTCVEANPGGKHTTAHQPIRPMPIMQGAAEEYATCESNCDAAADHRIRWTEGAGPSLSGQECMLCDEHLRIQDPGDIEYLKGLK